MFSFVQVGGQVIYCEKVARLPNGEKKHQNN